jgi:hypothetical protein
LGLKRRINQYDEPPKGMMELWELVEDEWKIYKQRYMYEIDREHAEKNKICFKSKRNVDSLLID